jgi:hypothetical protein
MLKWVLLACGEESTHATRMPHVAASPAYSPGRRRRAATNPPLTRVRSYSSTNSGAEIMTSLLPIPSPQQATAAANHHRPATGFSAPNPRIAQ